MRLYLVVWLGLLAIVAVEVAVTYARFPTPTQLSLLLTLALVEAGLGLLYFMHLKYERALLFWSLIPALVFVLLLMDHFWPDALRLLRLRVPTP